MMNAGKLAWRYVLLEGTDTVINVGNNTLVWNAASQDPHGVWDSAFPSRITIPRDIRYAEFFAGLDIGGVSVGTRISVYCAKNGFLTTQFGTLWLATGQDTNETWATKVHAVAPGDFFEYVVNTVPGTFPLIAGNNDLYFGAKLYGSLP